MLHSQDLYRLVQSLSKSEKRYFSIYARRHVIGSKNKYIALFELLDSMKNYSEEALKRRAQKVGIAKHLSTTKNYLYRLILAGMRSYETGRNVESSLREALQDVEFLLAKGLYDQCNRMLEKARRLAVEHEKFSLLLDILRKEREIISSRADISRDVERLFDEERRVVRMFNNLNEYQRLSARVFRVIRMHGGTRTSEELRQTRELRSHSLLAGEERALSNYARLFFYSIKAGIAYIEQDIHSMFENCRKHMELTEKLKHAGIATKEQYTDSLHNYIHAAFDAAEINAMQEGIRKLQALQFRDAYWRMRSFTTNASIRTILLLNSGKIDEIEQFLSEFETGYRQLEMSINAEQKRLFALSIAKLYFIIGDIDNALAWNNTILQEGRTELRQDVLSLAQPLNLILQYELGNYDHVASLLAVYRRRKHKYSEKDTTTEFIIQSVHALISAPAKERPQIARERHSMIVRNYSQQTASVYKSGNYSLMKQWLEKIFSVKKS